MTWGAGAPATVTVRMLSFVCIATRRGLSRPFPFTASWCSCSGTVEVAWYVVRERARERGADVPVSFKVRVSDFAGRPLVAALAALRRFLSSGGEVV